MSTNRSAPQSLTMWTVVLLVTIAVVATLGMLLLQYAPAAMGYGFLAGGGGMVLALLIPMWRVRRDPEAMTTLGRAWTHTGDERDRSVLTRALATLGLCAPVAVAAATIVLALGAPLAPTLAILNLGLVAIFALVFAVTNRRS